MSAGSISLAESDHPQDLRKFQRQHRERRDEEECDGQVYIQRHSLAALEGVRWMFSALGLIKSVQLRHLVGIVVLNQASSAVVNCLEIQGSAGHSPCN